jgi:transcriptional regulator of acetoin/glycerol metabolism
MPAPPQHLAQEPSSLKHPGVEGAYWNNSEFPAPLQDDWKANLAAAEKATVVYALKASNWNKSRATERLGIQGGLSMRKLREHKVEEPARG